MGRGRLEIGIHPVWERGRLEIGIHPVGERKAVDGNPVSGGEEGCRWESSLLERGRL